MRTRRNRYVRVLRRFGANTVRDGFRGDGGARLWGRPRDARTPADVRRHRGLSLTISRGSNGSASAISDKRVPDPRARHNARRIAS